VTKEERLVQGVAVMRGVDGWEVRKRGCFFGEVGVAFIVVRRERCEKQEM
jgi:hypothetical protein